MNRLALWVYDAPHMSRSLFFKKLKCIFIVVMVCSHTCAVRHAHMVTSEVNVLESVLSV